MDNKYSLEDIINDTTIEVAKKLTKFCYLEIPTEIADIAAMTKAGTLLGELTNKYSYLMAIGSLLKAICRATKKSDKDEWEVLVAKKEILEDQCRTVLQQYQAISRMISTKQEINREMNMY